MLILGLETSCDETASALVADGRRVLANVVATQHHLHEEYRGVVPEIASRAHLERLLPVVETALREAGVAPGDLAAVAVGNRPGLIGSLLVGVSAAKALAWALDRPLLGIDHVQAHLYAPLLRDSHSPDTSDEDPSVYPALGLVVSGGHTSLFLVRSPLHIETLGRTIDDAVGEAYDKAAVILGLGYPGGPQVDQLARQGDPARAPGGPLPRSLLDPDSLDFSFSGLKTALLYRVRGKPVGRGDAAAFPRSAADLDDAARADLAAAFQDAAVYTLLAKVERALDRLRLRGQTVQSLILGGGVSANSALRQRTLDLARGRGLAARLPPMAYCVDNAAMIAGLAFHRLQAGDVDALDLPAVATTSIA